MPRIAVPLLAAALLALIVLSFCVLVLRAVGGTESVTVFLALIAAAAALGSAGIALAARRRTEAAADSMGELASQVEGALREVHARTDRHGVRLDALADHLHRQSETVLAALELAGASGMEVADEEEVRSGPPAAANDQGSADTKLSGAGLPAEAAAISTALRSAARGDLALALVPILSGPGSDPAGFDVRLVVEPSGLGSLELRRPPFAVPGLDLAALERLLVERAADASEAPGTRLSLPLHVPVSDALLSSGRDFAAVLDLLTDLPSISRALVLSFPASSLAPGSGHDQAISLLAATGVRMAAEVPPASDMAAVVRRCRGRASVIRAEADRLLDLPTLPELSPGTSLLAENVRDAEQARRLALLGVRLMSGEGVSGPSRPVRPGPAAMPLVKNL